MTDETLANQVFIEIVTIRYRGYSFDCRATYTIFGEVLKIDNLFLQLPKQAQQMILGKDYVQIIDKIEALGKLLFYKIPLIQMGFVPTEYYPPSLKKEIDLQVCLTNYTHHVTDEWVRSLYDEYCKSERTRRTRGSRQFDKYLKRLVEILFKLESINDKEFFKNLRTHFSKLSFAVLRTLIPLAKQKYHLSHIYYIIATAKNLESRDYILQQFQDEQRESLRQYVLPAFKVIKGEEVYTLLIDFYNNNPDLRGKPLVDLLCALRLYETDKVVKIAWKHFKRITPWECEASFRILMKNIPESQIAEYLYDHLTIRHRPKVAASALKFLVMLPPQYYLPIYPLSISLLDFYREDHKTIGLAIMRYLAKTVRHRPEDITNMISVFTTLFTHKDRSLRRAGVHLASQFQYNEKYRTFIFPVIKNAIGQLLSDEAIVVQKEVLSYIHQGIKDYFDQEWIPVLLQKLRRDLKRKGKICSSANLCLKMIAKHHTERLEQWKKHIVDFYLEIIQHSAVNTSAIISANNLTTVIFGLCHFPEQRVKIGLLELQRHLHREYVISGVNKSIEYALESINDKLALDDS